MSNDLKNVSPRILQVDGKDVINGDFKIKSFRKFKATFDNSLELMHIKKIAKKILPKEKILYKNTENKLDNKYYTNLIISVTFKYKTCEFSRNDIRTHLYKNGFYVDGKKYVRFKRSSGASRIGQCLFIREELIKEMDKYSYMDLDIKENDEIDLASMEAYISLTTSSIIDTLKIKANEILVIDDFESTFIDNDVCVSSYENEKLITREGSFQLKNSIFDGQSLLDVSVFEDNNYSDKGMLLLRNNFFKSCCFNTNIQDFFKDNNIKSIKQLKGFTLAKNIESIKLITTPSSIKYIKFGKIENYFKQMNETFGIVKYDKPTHYFEGQLVKSHYQLINTLELNKDDMMNFLKDTIEYIYLLKNSPEIMRYHLKIKSNETLNSNILDFDNINNFIFSLLSVNDNITKTKLYQTFCKDLIKNMQNDFRKGHILINGNYSTICGNPLEMLYHSIGKFDGNSFLNKDEIITSRFEKGKELVCVRSPHITMGNLWLVKNVRHNEILKYMNITKQIVIINSIGNSVLDRLNGCDFDSDTILITDNKYILEKTKLNYNNFKVPVLNIPAKKKKRYNTPEDKADLDIKTSINKIGEIVNLSQILNSYLWELKKQNKCYKEVYIDICSLATLSIIEIDSAKKEYEVDTSLELKNMREKYDFLMDKKPMFFYYLIDEETRNEKKDLIDKYKQYDTAMDFLNEIIGNLNKLAKKERNKKQLDISDLFYLDTIDIKKCNYRQIKKIETEIEKYKILNYNNWNDNSLTKQQKYLNSLDIEKELYLSIKKINISINTLQYIIKSLENTSKRKLISLLFNTHREQVVSLLKKVRSEYNVIELNLENNEYDYKIFNLNFIKKY